MRHASDKKIPLNIAIAGIIYALFTLIMLGFGVFERISITIETVMLFAIFVYYPLCSVIGLFSMRLVGWYACIILPVAYLFVALVFWLLAVNNIHFSYWHANEEFSLGMTDVQQLLATITFWSALGLAPAALFLFTPATFNMIHRRQSVR